tara:strand:+ start:46904 stop:48460 length:1557 start_codon:yes stop_codon:yes gene_type:complete
VYKLVVVAGKLRGKEFSLEDGENILGRDSGCDVHFPVQGVSKKHMSITVTGDTCYVQDLGSSNGTFLNGKIVNRATAKNGDKIALPDTIIQVVHVEEKKVIIKKRKIEEEEEEDDFLTGGIPPEALPQKLKWLFKYKAMPILHGINEEYEWKHLFPMLLFLFCVASITSTILPVLDDTKQILLYETSKRAESYAKQVARMNNKALVQKKLDQTDTKFIKDEDGVKDYRLMDFAGRVVRPLEKRNEYVNDPFYVQSREYYSFEKNKLRVFRRFLKEGGIGIAKLITAFNPQTSNEEPVGIIAIKFDPAALKAEAANQRKAYMEALVTTVLVAMVFFGIVYYLTLRPIEEMKYQIEEAIRGKRKSLDSKYLMEELNPLRGSINTILQRMRELNNEDEGEFAEEENDQGYVDTLKEFMMGANGAAMVLDSQKNVCFMNSEAEDLCGFRENASQGMNLLDVSREQGFSGTVIELCDNSANNMGTNQSAEYELSGIPHVVNVAALMGKDGFAKAFYLTFVRAD